jgi:hypothetical protein
MVAWYHLNNVKKKQTRFTMPKRWPVKVMSELTELSASRFILVRLHHSFSKTKPTTKGHRGLAWGSRPSDGVSREHAQSCLHGLRGNGSRGRETLGRRYNWQTILCYVRVIILRAISEWRSHYNLCAQLLLSELNNVNNRSDMKTKRKKQHNKTKLQQWNKTARLARSTGA